MFDEFLIPITESDILKEVSEELNLPIEDVNKTYKIWLKYLKHISKNTDQCMIDFPELGKMYFSTERTKFTTSSEDKKYRNCKVNTISNFFCGVEFENYHHSKPIVHRWGLSRPDFSKYDKQKFTLNDLVNKQNKKFYEGSNKFIK